MAILLALPRQFGRQRYLQATHSNDLLHYLTAVGQYKANIDNNQAQVADNRAALLTKIALRVPYLQGIHGIDARCAMIAKDCQLPIKTVYQGLYASWQTDEEFLGVGQAFAQLWQHYY